MPSVFKRQLSGLEFGDHLFLLFADGDEHLAGLPPTMIEAFERGHRCLHVGAADDVGPVLLRPRRPGLDVEKRREDGSLRFVEFETEKLLRGALEPEALGDEIAGRAEEARSADHDALWLVVEIPLDRDSGVRGEHVHGFEAKLFDHLTGTDLLVACQFDRRALGDDLLAWVLEIHPHAAFGGSVHPKPFYVPRRAVPDE